MTDAELREMAAHGNDVATALLALRAAVRREREAYISYVDDTGSIKKEDAMLSARAEVAHLVAGEKD